MVVILYAAMLCNPPIAASATAFLRVAAVSAVAFSAVAGIVALGWNTKKSSEQALEYGQAAYQKDLSELDQVTADAPLEKYFDFTLADNRAKDIKELAIQRMQARRDYVTGLAALLRGPRWSGG